jgi:hypothetical protein
MHPGNQALPGTHVGWRVIARGNPRKPLPVGTGSAIPAGAWAQRASQAAMANGGGQSHAGPTPVRPVSASPARHQCPPNRVPGKGANRPLPTGSNP